jgi:hypothetical protein
MQLCRTTARHVKIRFIIAQLVHAFDFQLCEGQDADAFERSAQGHFGMVFVPGSLFADFVTRDGKS